MIFFISALSKFILSFFLLLFAIDSGVHFNSEIKFYLYRYIYIFAYVEMRIDMEFKKLEIKPEGNWVKRNVWTPHGRKTMIYIAVGAVAGIVVFVVTQDNKIAEITAGEIIKSMAMGGFFGFFITNSPCARNQC